MKKWIGTEILYKFWGSEYGNNSNNNFYCVPTMYPVLVPSSTIHAAVHIVIVKR